MKRTNLNIRGSLRNIRQTLFPNHKNAYITHRRNLRSIRMSRDYVRKYNTYQVPRTKTALDLKIDLDKPEHLKSLRE